MSNAMQIAAQAALTTVAKQAFGVELPTEQLVAFATVAAQAAMGASWYDATQAGVRAAERIRTEADAERARRERLGE